MTERLRAGAENELLAAWGQSAVLQPAIVSLASSARIFGRASRWFGAVSWPFVVAMINATHDLAPGGSVCAQFVRSDPYGHEAAALDRIDQRPICGALVSTPLVNFFKNNAVLADCAPKRG
jgi:hypothetical protein